MDEHMEQIGLGAPEPARKEAQSRLTPKVMGIAALVVIALLGGMYIWKAVSERRLVAQHAAEREALLQESLHGFAVPFSWAVRREAMASNLDQIDQYFTDLVQMPGFESATLAGPDGRVTVASDRRRLGQPLEAYYPAAQLQAEQIELIRLPDGRLGIVVPILGLRQRLATAVVEYRPGAYPRQ